MIHKPRFYPNFSGVLKKTHTNENNSKNLRLDFLEVIRWKEMNI